MRRVGTAAARWHTAPMHMPGGNDDARTVLDALFPPGVATILSLSAPPGASLASEEEACAGRFAPTRLAEFRHGRACVRAAFARLGAAPAAVPIGAQREPVWPMGMVGSISHAGTAAAAVVGRSSDFRSLGLDIDSDEALEPELWARICLPEERVSFAASGESEGHSARLVFSIKEAAYKAIWPVTRQFLEFHDLAVTPDIRTGRFTVASRSALCPHDLAEAVEGRFARYGALVVTGAALRR